MQNKFDFRDFLHFDKMISPAFLTVVYYIYIIVSMLGSLYLIMKGLDAPFGGSLMVLGGFASLLIGPFLIRLLFELLIVIFQIHTRLSSIDLTLRGKVADPPTEAHFVEAPSPSPAPAPVYQAPDNLSNISTPVAPPPAFTAHWSSQSARPATVPGVAPDINLKSIGVQVPNWLLVISSVVTLFCIVSPYASIGPDLPIVGSLLSNSFSIKNSPAGIVAVLGALAMILTSAGGAKWLWFVIAYVVTVLTSVLAFMSDSSLFSQFAQVKAGIRGTVNSGIGQLFPEAGRLSDQMVQSAPGASQFLNMSFYLLIISVVFAGYWALSGRYHEKGFFNQI